MRERSATLNLIQRGGVVSVIRAESSHQALDICRALAEGGITAVEIAMTTPGALVALEKASEELEGDCVVGVGSVLDAATCRSAILAGAEFVVSPVFDPGLVEMAHRYGRPAIPGALTPTEILKAWSHGADMIKIFPANHFGPRYFEDLTGPMPQLRLTPTGGVDLTTVKEWIRAGAVCVGVGSALVQKEAIRRGDWAKLTSLARQFVDEVQAARSEAL